MNKSKLLRDALRNAPAVKDARELAANPSLPRPHRPTPTSQLSWPRKVRRGVGFLAFVSSIALAVSAATASSDWNVRSDDADPR